MSQSRKHSHYFKDVSHLVEVDVYRVLALFNVTDQALGHAIKKLLVAGGRGAGKDIDRDVAEAIDTLQRWQEMQFEDSDLSAQLPLLLPLQEAPSPAAARLLAHLEAGGGCPCCGPLAAPTRPEPAAVGG